MKAQNRNKAILPSAKIVCCEGGVYSEIFHNSPTAMSLSSLESLETVDVNEAWEKFTGYTKKEVLDKSAKELPLLDTAQLQKIQNILRDKGIMKSHEIELLRKNGEKAYGLATFQYVNLQEATYVQTTIIDISNLKKINKELSIATKFSERLLDSMYEAIFILDKDLKCIRINKSYTELTGFTEKDVIGTKAPFPHWPSEEFDNIQSYSKNCLTGNSRKSELVFKKANGERFQVLVSTTEILNHQNEIIGYASTAVDISEKVKYQNELLEKSKKATDKKDAILKLLNTVGKDLCTLLKDITKISAKVLEVNRVSIWEFNEDETQIQCVNAYHLQEDEFKNSEKLETENYPNYFKKLYSNKIIKINDVNQSEFDNNYKVSYLNKYGISSMLDVFVYGIKKPFGVLCFEHIGEARDWTPEEEQFATTVSSLASLAIENTERKKIQKKLVKTNEKLTEANTNLNHLKKELEQQNVYLREEINLVFNYEEMVYGSAVFSNVLTDLEKVADTDATVLLLGESGTGKELVARAIHNISERSTKPLIKVNCAAIPKELIESEMFGHKKGSFTGAFSDKEGKFKLADGGTLFLDEIGELPLDMQPKLLRAIQEHEIEPIGSSKVQKVNIRIVAATNRNLKKEVKKKNFREDLYFRLNVFPIEIPPLRERPEDIPILIEHFVDKFCKKYNKKINFISQDTRHALYNYNWPGNIRELENLIERAVILANSETLVVPGFKSSEKEAPISSTALTLDDVQRMHITQTLKQCGWKIDGTQGAAELLDIKPSTLRDRMKKLGVKKP